MIIYGKNPVFESVKTGKAKTVFIRKGAALYDVDFTCPVQIMNKQEFEGRFGRETQGVAAEIDNIPIYKLSDAIHSINETGKVIILDRIQDPNNFGAIIRSAQCFGVKDIVVPRYNQSPVSASVCKASAGAIFYTNIIEETNLNSVIDELKQQGFTIIATALDSEVSLSEYSYEGKKALIIGSEGRGIRESLLHNSDVVLKIPMSSGVGSLNAAQSAAIALYSIFNKS